MTGYNEYHGTYLAHRITLEGRGEDAYGINCGNDAVACRATGETEINMERISHANR
ncbi:MAG: hypothetical protein ACK5NY_05665 [Burkholderiaceae bacterium]